MKYKNILTKFMTELSEDKDTIFIGQQVRFKGNPMTTTLINVPEIQKIELPIMEDAQMGISIGLSMTGKRVVTFYPRWDFLIIAANQLITHADNFKKMTNKDLHIIVRVGKGSEHPLDPGPQHKNNYSESFKLMSKSITYFDCKTNHDLQIAYKIASEKKGVYVITEYPELYDTNTTFNLLPNNDYEKRFLQEYPLVDYEICDINEVKSRIDENFFIIHYTTEGYLSVEILKKQTLPINDDIKEHIRNNKNLKILFLLSHECDTFLVTEIVNTFCEKELIPKNQIYVINDNSIMDEIKHHNIPNFKTFYPIPKSCSKTVTVKHPDFYFEKNKKHLFTLYNKELKTHRIAILAFMKKMDYLKFCDWSFLTAYKFRNSYNMNVLHEIFSPEEIESYKSEFEYLKSFDRKFTDYETQSTIDRASDQCGIPFYEIYSENPFKYSYFNIVTESQFLNENVIHITEKSIVPLYFSQIPIFLATKGHVSKLKEKYGFDLFEDIIDHSYDQEPDPQIRFQMVCNQIIKIVNDRDKFVNLYNLSDRRFRNNKSIVAEIKNHTEEVDYIRSIINNV